MPFEITDQWSISLKIDGQDIPLSQKELQKVYITESIEQLFPTIEIGYTPFKPIFTEILPLRGREDLKMDLSRNRQQDKSTFDFVLDYREPDPDSSNETEQSERIIGMQRKFIDHAIGSQVRSFTDKKISSIVQEIVGGGDIQQTNYRKKFRVQPNVPDSWMLRYLKRKAVSNNDGAAFFSYFDSKGKFHFKTLKQMYKDSSKKTLNYGAGSEDQNTITFRDMYTDTFRPWTKGAIGAKAYGFDWEAGKPVQKEREYTDQSHNPLSSRVPVKSEFTDATANVLSSGRTELKGAAEDQIEKDADRMILHEMPHVIRFDVFVQNYFPNLRAGDKIRIKIFNSDFTGKQETVYSGQWLIHTKTDVITDQFLTKFSLIRDGLNQPRRFPNRMLPSSAMG